MNPENKKLKSSAKWVFLKKLELIVINLIKLRTMQSYLKLKSDRGG